MPKLDEPEHGLDGEYARDPHHGGLGDNYARDGGWSGGGKADDVVREEEKVEEEDHGEVRPSP